MKPCRPPAANPSVTPGARRPARTLRRIVPVVLAAVLLHGLTGAADAPDSARAPARQTAPWVRESVLYEIFPRAFSATGDFNGITQRLDELDDLGVDVLWLMPIHPCGQKNRKGSLGSPYAVRDYYAVDPAYGTLDDFRRLVREAHARGLKVIIDIVANHTAWDSVLMEHPEFYLKDEAGNIRSPNSDWTDVAGLDYANPGLRRYMIDMLVFWLKDVGVDGFRCDVAFLVPTDFWEAAREALEEVNPDVVMLAEASEPALLVRAFDLDYAWPMHGTLNDVLLRGAPADRFQETWRSTRARFPDGALHLRISDNHDEARAVARFGIQGALVAQVLMLTLDGVPLFYNGMEVGDATESGAPALFEQLPVFWQPKERPPLRSIYRDLIQLRKAHPAFTNNRVHWLQNSNPHDLVTFMRSDATDEFLVVLNFSNRPITGSVEAPHPRQFRRIAGHGDRPAAVDALPDFELGGFGWAIYHRPVSH